MVMLDILSLSLLSLSLSLSLTHTHTHTQATGSRVGTLIETMVGALLALGIALAYSWLMTIVILLVVPLVMFAGALQLKALTTHASSNKKQLEKAGNISVDSIENIRTVASLTIEDNFYEQYKVEVKRPYRYVRYNTNAGV